MSTNKAVIIRINKCVAAFNIKVPIKRLMNRYEEESNEARQIILCRMPKNNEMHSFKHVLVKYTRTVFLVYYAIKIMTTCLYNEVKMKVYKTLSSLRISHLFYQK